MYGSTFAAMSPGRKPSRSPASTAGRVRMMRPTWRSESAATASATARYVLPVPAGPIPNVNVEARMASTYRFCVTVFGVIRLPRCDQTTSSKMSRTSSAWSIAFRIVNAIDQAEDVRDIFEDVVWSHRGKRITPKTVVQKQYVDAIRTSTVTFGIGPAGTGKTYLAIALAVAALSERQVGRI